MPTEHYRDVNTLASEHTGCDLGEIVYVDYEGMEANPSNYYDIMAVYMVKHGVGDTATVMNDKSKDWLQAVVNDMCSYTTSTGNKDVEETDDQGNVVTATKSVLYVNVTLKSYRDMISIYGFDNDQKKLLEDMMNSEFMAQLGYSGSGSGGGGGSPGVSSMTEDEINAVLSGITDNRLKTTCSYALHRVGYPYSQDMRDSGNYYDCSSLAYYSWKDAGVDISHGGATTAAAEAQGLDEAGKSVSYDEMTVTEFPKFNNKASFGTYSGYISVFHGICSTTSGSQTIVSRLTNGSSLSGGLITCLQLNGEYGIDLPYNINYVSTSTTLVIPYICDCKDEDDTIYKLKYFNKKYFQDAINKFCGASKINNLLNAEEKRSEITTVDFNNYKNLTSALKAFYKNTTITTVNMPATITLSPFFNSAIL